MPLQFDQARRLVQQDDPIWPQRRFLDQRRWDVLRQVDGIATAAQIVARLTPKPYTAQEVRTSKRL